jgi:hypothetical protein
MTAATDAVVAIQRLQSAYADAINRRDWADLVPLFAPDAPVRIDTVTRPVIDVVGPIALGEFIAGAVERFAFFEFVRLNSHLELDDEAAPTAATGRLFMCEVRRDVDTLDWSVAYGIYRDRYELAGSGWRFAGRDYQSLTRTDGPVFPFPASVGHEPSVDPGPQ